MQTTGYGTSPSTSGMMNSVNTLSTASSSAYTAVDSAAEAADSAIRQAKPAIEKVAQMAHRAVDKAAASAVPAADWIGEKTDRLDATQKKLVNDTCAYITANPLKAIGLALLAGVVLSRMTRAS